MRRLLLGVALCLMLSPNFAQITFRTLGSSGNAFGVQDPNVNPLSVNTKLNTVVFIHRTNFKVFTNDDGNNGEYRYDISKNGGTSFDINLGKLNPSGTESGKACRFPNVTIYNPLSNITNNPDSAWLVYFGTYHNGGTAAAGTPTWKGFSHGRAKLTGAPSTFTDETIIPAYRTIGKEMDVISSMCNGIPGEFWNITHMDSLLSATQVIIDTFIYLNKGVWSASDSVKWTYTRLPMPARDYDLTILNQKITFDPTGKYAYVTYLADPIGNGVFTLNYYKSADSGQTWSTRQFLDLYKVLGIDTSANSGNTKIQLVNYAPLVDTMGNLHMAAFTALLDASNNTAFSDFFTNSTTDNNSKVYYIGNDPTQSAGCQWYSTDITQYKTIRGTVASFTGGTFTSDNRLQAGSSDNGKFGFFSWLDNTSGGSTNSEPNIRMFGVDFLNKKVSKVKEITKGDANFSGKAFQMVASKIVFNDANGWELPYVVCEFESPSAPNSENPIFFKYLDNIKFNKNEISTKVFGSRIILADVFDTIYIKLDSQNNVINDWKYPAYSKFNLSCSGAGNGSGSTIDSTKVIPNAHGNVGSLTYVTKEGGITTDSVIFPLVALAPPVIDFTTPPVIYNKNNYTYINNSNDDYYRIVKWNWVLGQGTSTLRQPTVKYTVPGTYTVTATATNKAGGFNKKSKTVDAIVGVGIINVEMDNKINLYPNPAKDNVSLIFNETFTKFNVVIIDVLGNKSVLNQKFGKVSSNVNINISSIPSGIYIMEIETEKGVAVKKLTIQ